LEFSLCYISSFLSIIMCLLRRNRLNDICQKFLTNVVVPNHLFLDLTLQRLFARYSAGKNYCAPYHTEVLNVYYCYYHVRMTDKECIDIPLFKKNKRTRIPTYNLHSHYIIHCTNSGDTANELYTNCDLLSEGNNHDISICIDIRKILA